ncbi:hypothetical protein DFH09DRAFT_1196914 [Mycena vulgaris]|nr:hypothetical protein DFH09DRAFT_1196914 [Mycena vulgaris]
MALVLPNDVLDRILERAPTFKTLQAAILVSKTWYHVFLTHPKSLVRSVTENVVGPALPEAMRVLRYHDHAPGGPEWTETGAEDGSAIPKTGEAEMTREEYRLLRQNAAVVKQLEVLFSLRYRDQLARTSQLTWAESYRFSRAIYRVMLYCAVFRMPTSEDDVREMEESPTERGRIVQQRIAMLNQYSTEELLELNAVLEFLRAVAQDSGEKSGYFQDDEDMPDGAGEWVLSAGPAAILQAHRTNADFLVEKIGITVWISGPFTLLSGFFVTPLQSIWDRRNVPTPPHADTGGQENPLLDSVTFRSPPCDQCALVSTTKLWHEHNWDALHLDIHGLLKGNLRDNFTELEALREAHPSKNIPQLVSELFARRTEEFLAWNKTDSLCGACLKKFISAHLHLWLYDKRVEDSWDAPEDCWYGYECRTQTSVTLHALTKNHLCAPTRQWDSGDTSE